MRLETWGVDGSLPYQGKTNWGIELKLGIVGEEDLCLGAPLEVLMKPDFGCRMKVAGMIGHRLERETHSGSGCTSEQLDMIGLHCT